MAPQRSSRGKDGGRGEVRVGVAVGEGVRVWVNVRRGVSTDTVRQWRSDGQPSELERLSRPVSFIVNVPFIQEAG